MIGRRTTIAALLATAVAPALGQQPLRRVGVMIAYTEADAEGRARLAAFMRAMQDLGWEEGRTVRYDLRWYAGNMALAREHARELASLSPDAILVNGTIGVIALREVGTSIPITFVVVVDPVGGGFVQSLARPGGNITGFSSFEPELGPKWLELIKAVAPSTMRVAVLTDPAVMPFTNLIRVILEGAPGFGLTAEIVAARNGTEIASGLRSALRPPNTGLIVLPTAINSVERGAIRQIAAGTGTPAIYPFAFHAREGGLIAYGFDGVDLFSRAARYVSRMLNGESPANLPVQAPTKFELAINVKTARALGLEIPLLLLSRADEVIE